MHPRNGFSLIELSVIMTVMAAALVAALTWISPSADTHAKAVAVTRERMVNVQKALRAYRSLYGRLPCPANPTYGLDHPNYGIEDCWLINGVGARMHGNVMRGAVPVRTLGIMPDNIRDGWERYFTYQISRQICDFDPTAAIIGQVGAPTNCTPDDYQNGTGLAGAGTEWLTMRTTDPAIGSCNPPIITNCPATLSTNIAYVLVSHGPDGDRAYTTNGGLRQVAASLGAMEERQEINAHENANDTQFWTDRFSSDFDDFLLFETREQIEMVTVDFDRFVMTLAQCQNFVTNVLGNFTRAESVAIDGAAGLTPLFGVQAVNEAVLGMLWELQEICIRYYPAFYNDTDNIACPGGFLPNGRVFDVTVWDQYSYPDDTNDGGYGDWSNPSILTNNPNTISMFLGEPPPGVQYEEADDPINAGDIRNTTGVDSYLTRLGSGNFLYRRIGYCRCPTLTADPTPDWNTTTGTCQP